MTEEIKEEVQEEDSPNWDRLSKLIDERLEAHSARKAQEEEPKEEKPKENNDSRRRRSDFWFGR